VSGDGTVLVVENETNMRRVLGTLLRRDGLRVLEAGDGQEALEVLGRERVDAVLTDLKMPRMNGLELLAEAARHHPGLPVVLLTAFGTVGSAVEALKKGAFDYLTKPFDPEELRQVLAKAVRTRALQESEATAPPDDSPESLMVGQSRALAQVREVIERVAPTPATVLITGESGTGKELVARSLHLRSPRHDAPFVKINCAAIPESLFESELFGYEKGAFTGAGARKPGRFELADRGTLFLDEIGEMPLSTQPKLLRALQEGRFFRVGGTRVVSVDVRLVAATNRELFAEVRSGRFREDLFYRLHVVPIHMPALRERREDIPALAELFVQRFARKLHREALAIDPEALAALRLHEWPGNIRELENAIERALLLADEERIRLRDLPAEVTAAAERARSCALGASLRELVRHETRRIERQAICAALAATGGNVTRAAAQLGLSRRGLQLKMKELDVRGRDCDGDPESD
jgi:DNA-binding NtrC family response regulator